MQEKKFDSNQLVGFILIFVLLGAFFYWNQPTEEEKKANLKKQEQLKKQEPEETIPVAKSTIDTLQLKEVIGKDAFIENDKLSVTIGSLGGQITELEMKNQFAYDSTVENKQKPLYLIQKNNRFNLSFTDRTGRIIQTAALPFQSQIQKQDSTTVVRMKAQIESGSLEYVYTLEKGYSIDLQIISKELKSFTNDSVMELSWNLNAFALEKGRRQELTYTDTHFRLKEDQDIDYDRGEWDEEEKVDWVAFKQQFFASILQFKDGFEYSRGNLIAHDESHPTYIKDFTFSAKLPVAQQELNYAMQWDFVPLENKVLKTYKEQNYSQLIPFGLWGGGGFIGWLNKQFFLRVYNWLSALGIGVGWIIILMTIVVKLILSPVMYRQFKQSAMMKVIKPEIDEINEKHKGSENAMKRQQEVMAVQKKAGVNMLAGCVPALLQMPLFYALFRFFPNLFDLRGKGFLWAEDLTSYDSIIQLPFTVPFGFGAHVSLFALMYVVVMVIYFRVSGSMSNFQTAPPQEGMPDMRFMKYMMYVMPIFFFVFLNSYASGLSLYYLASNGINIGIVLFIKNVLIDEKKIHKKIEENRAKPQKKESRWQRKMKQMMDKAQQQKELQQQKKKK